MKRTLPLLLILICFAAAAQYEKTPLWKSEYDSAQIYWKHDITKSVHLLASAEKVALNDLGMYDDNYLTILSDLGLAYGELKDFPKAEKYLAQNLRIHRELYSGNDPHVLQSNANLASILIRSGRDDQAKSIYLDVFKQAKASSDFVDGAIAALGLIHIYEYHELYDSAGVVIRAALAQPAADGESPARHELMLAEGRILRKQKKYSDAVNVLTRLEGVLQNSDGVTNPLLAGVSLEVSLVDIDLGLYQKAESSLLSQYRVLKASKEQEDELLTEITTGLGYLYEKIGVYDKALAYYRESLGRCELSYGYYSVNCMILQNNIAGIYLHQGKINEAIDQYGSFFIGYKKSSDAVWWSAINNLASAYRQAGRFEEALEKFQEVYDHLAKAHQLGDDLAATVMNNMAVTYTMTGRSRDAIAYFEKALRIKEHLYGKDSPVLIDLTSNLAVALWMEKKYNDAMPLFRQSLKLAEREVRYVFPNLTESEQVEFYRHQKENFERFNTVALTDPSPAMLVQMFNSQLLLKSLTFFTNQKVNREVRDTHDPKLKQALDQLQAKGAQLNNYFQMPLHDLAALHVSLPALEHQIDSLEKIIHGAGFNQQPSKAVVAWQDVRDALQSDEALVEIIRFRKYDALPNTASSKQTVRIGFTDSVTYAALVTTKLSKEGPELVIFKNGRQMETRFLAYFRNTRRFSFNDTISYTKFWLPIEQKLHGIKKVFFTADGVYHQLSLNSVHDLDGKYILEQFDLHLLMNSGQHLSGIKNPDIDFSRIVLMGDPIFTAVNADTTTSRSYHQRERLPGTQIEIAGILTALRLGPSAGRVYTGTRANESNFKNLVSPSVLHIATHGFFSTNVIYLNEQVRNEYMFHSGLLLSPERREQKSLTDTDGIITASDVMGMNLQNTDLVVLSACETGLGKIENSEGVYGLQRSFLQAGAKQLVISLWKVDDQMTKDLMIGFYQYMATGKSCRESFRLAQSDMLHKSNDPGKWGAFVLVSRD